MFKKLIGFTFFFLCVILKVHSQIPGLTQFTTNNNLPSNTIYDITQDEHGFIWFATDYGVSKFDGLSFENFTVNDGLPGNEILYFYRDSKNRIWMASFNGNIGYLKNGIFYNNKNSTLIKNLSFTTYLSDITEDFDGNIWFFQNTNNIKVLRNNSEIATFSLEYNSNINISPTLIQDSKNRVHLLGKEMINNKPKLITYHLNNINKTWKDLNTKQYTNNSTYKLNNNVELILRIDEKPIKLIYKYLEGKKNRYLLNMYDIDSSIWITNLNHGIHIFDSHNNYKTSKVILSNVETTKAYVDLEKNIWVGSQSNGVFLFPNVNVTGFQLDNPQQNNLYSINTFNKNLVLGNELGEVIILDKNKLEVKFSKKIDTYSKKIRHLQKYDNQMYIVSDFSIHEMDKTYKIKATKDMYDTDFVEVDLKNFKQLTFHKDTILTANANGISQININSKRVKRIWDKRSTSILQVGNDSLWIGTTTGLYLKTKVGFKKFKLNTNFDNNIIYDLKKSKHGLLIASNSFGLGILNNKGFFNISTSNGLLSNYIKSIHVDSNNDIWLSSNLGLNNVKLINSQIVESITTYTTSDGLYSNDVRACYVDIPKKKAYVATSNGLNIIDFSKNSSITIPPKIVITDKLVNNTTITDDNTEFDYNANNIQFNFSGISYKSLGNIKFKYRLLGIEPNWIETKNNTVRYSLLQPNTYTFEVKAIAKNKLESKISETFTFSINPPLYETWWFKTLIGFLIIIIIYISYFVRKRRKQAAHQIEEKIASLRFKALNAQMNPHFINNLLGNINDQIALGKFSKVENNLKYFGNLVNLILDATKNNLISLKAEIEMTTLYLKLQKSRFHNNLNYEINTSKLSNDDLEFILIPPMILQPIVENSIKHGFQKSNKENNIFIELLISKNKYLICEISDNGLGKEDNNQLDGSGISLKNIENRLQLMCETQRNEKLVIVEHITNDFNKLVGLKVTLKIPLIKF